MSQVRHVHPDNAVPCVGWVFVFASTVTGHEPDSCTQLAQERFGAHDGLVSGPCGQAFALALKDPSGRFLAADAFALIEEFCAYARARPWRKFFISKMFAECPPEKATDIALAFSASPLNCSIPQSWSDASLFPIRQAA